MVKTGDSVVSELDQTAFPAMTPRVDNTARQHAIMRVVVWSALGVMLLARAAKNVVDLDIFHQMALIRAALSLGHLPTQDLFSYAPTIPYSVHHEWGSGVIAFFVSQWFGAAGILVLKYGLIGTIAWLCVKVARARMKDPLPILSTLGPVAILFAGDAFAPIRAHLYSLTFVALLLYCLERDRAGDRRWIACWLPLSIVWINLHGGFVFGIAVLGIQSVECLLTARAWRHLALTAGVMLGLVIVNPYGAHYYPFLFESLRMSRPGVAEWMSPLQPVFSFYSNVFVASLAVVAYAVWSKRPRAVPGLAVLCAMAAEAALHRRMAPFYALAWISYVPAWLENTAAGRWCTAIFQKRALVLQTVWMIVGLFFLQLAFSLHFWKLMVPGEGSLNEIAYPVGPIEYLAKQHFRGNVMVPFEYGAYVSWKLYPAVRVSLDSRYEAAYPAAWVGEQARLYDAELGWEEMLASMPTDVVIAQHAKGLARAIAGTNWQRVFSDASYEVWARPGLAMPVGDRGAARLEGRFP
jgi:hypothetical protein